MKKLINHPSDVVREMLEGVVSLSPGQRLLANETVVIQADLPPPAERAVAILSGGGSGHEPAHAGYVGQGMLAAAIAGDVFTSPSTDAVLAGIKSVAGAAGAVLIVKNYTGDRLNFGLAAEMARAEGVPVEVVIVADDVSLHATVDPARRRGIAGTVLVHKVAGAAAARGASLTEVARIARGVAADLGSMGVALGACTLPAVGNPSFELAATEIELGLGIHGEPGVQKAAMDRVENLVAQILSVIVNDRQIKTGTHLALLVNGLGATPPMELAIVARDALRYLRTQGFVVERAWSGTLLSALDMPGFSLSLLPVDEQRLNLLDAATNAPAWPGSGELGPVTSPPNISQKTVETHSQSAISRSTTNPMRSAALAIADALMASENLLTELDAKAGDGDLGSSMARGAAAITALPEEAWTTPEHALTNVGHALRRAIAGSSGPFYATAALRAARSLAGKTNATPVEWAEAFTQAVASISELGGARLGDRTMVDALQPAADTFAMSLRNGQTAAPAWALAVEAGRRGCEATAAMVPRLGRASYLGTRAVGIPDAGATAVTVWLNALTPHITGTT